ncbi:MAG: hypothetical protein ACE5GK_00100 [Nitrospiria bacterium]
MRHIISVSILAILLVLPFHYEAALGDEFGRNGNLIILIQSNKPQYEIGEPILITASLRNHTDQPLFVNQLSHPSTGLEWELIYDGFGPVPVKIFPPVVLKKEDFIRLDVSEELVRVLPELNEIVSTPLKAGRYALRLTYQNKEKIQGDETWTGVIITNLLWFEVKTPEKI